MEGLLVPVLVLEPVLEPALVLVLEPAPGLVLEELVPDNQ